MLIKKIYLCVFGELRNVLNEDWKVVIKDVKISIDFYECFDWIVAGDVCINNYHVKGDSIFVYELLHLPTELPKTKHVYLETWLWFETL